MGFFSSVRTGLTAIGVAAVLGMTAIPAAAQTVTLTSHDGTITLRGTLASFDGETYVLSTMLGNIPIEAIDVTCEGDGCPAPEVLLSEFRVAGSDTIGAELMPALVEGYGFAIDADITQGSDNADGDLNLILSNENGEVTADISIASEGSSSSFRELLAGTASLGMSSRPIRRSEADELGRSGYGNMNSTEQEHILALDGMLVIVADNNPIRSLTMEDMGAIFAGRITNWAQVGGPDAPINLYIRDGNSGTRSVFEGVVLRPYGFEFSSAALEFEDNAELSDAVAVDPFGIGFTGFSYERNARALGIREVCGIQTFPSTFAIKAEEYPLARRLYLYNTNQPMPSHARKLLDFVLSEEAQDIISATGFIDQSIDTATMNQQGQRMAASIMSTPNTVALLQLQEMVGTMINAQRLSTTFRFQPGSSLLDAKAQNDVVRMANLLARGGFANKEVMLVGFTDSIGREDLNRALSVRRADQVRQAIVDQAPAGTLDDVDLVVLGFGETSPVGCNETFSGRSVNRRVEVWVRDKI